MTLCVLIEAFLDALEKQFRVNDLGTQADYALARGK
ncbi:hypothetical protein SEA_REYNAULD_46 [Rhodococcus phage Reynauld]|uniref:Uncharacterized protein n=1 Tax=Rhodococcus phage Reynauld TaxID=3062845 RepID=A0ACD4UHJ1_9CAUD|nr:hypothetical protein SEA_REYNAULD_46 [Rhodococcus phage Reynauld]